MTKTFYKIAIAGLAAWLCCQAEAQAAAETGFFGYKMRSESYARELIKREDFKVSTEAFPDSEGIDKSVYATARFKYTLPEGYVMEVTIFNHSKTDIPAPIKFTEFIIIFKDGQRQELTKPGVVVYPYTEKILPGVPLRLMVDVGGRRFDKNEIEMIVCSFNLGDTKIVMVPLPDKPPAPKPYRPIVEHVRPTSAIKEVTTQKPPAAKAVSKPAPVPKPYRPIVEHVRPGPAVKEAGTQKPPAAKPVYRTVPDQRNPRPPRTNFQPANRRTVDTFRPQTVSPILPSKSAVTIPKQVTPPVQVEVVKQNSLLPPEAPSSDQLTKPDRPAGAGQSYEAELPNNQPLQTIKRSLTPDTAAASDSGQKESIYE
jgi:hypothetical protein